MDACAFVVYQEGTDLQEAFRCAVEAARTEHGHSGYTDSIAEKTTVIVIEARPRPWEEARTLAAELIDSGDPRVDDTRGPAGAIAVAGTRRTLAPITVPDTLPGSYPSLLDAARAGLDAYERLRPGLLVDALASVPGDTVTLHDYSTPGCPVLFTDTPDAAHHPAGLPAPADAQQPHRVDPATGRRPVSCPPPAASGITLDKARCREWCDGHPENVCLAGFGRVMVPALSPRHTRFAMAGVPPFRPGCPPGAFTLPVRKENVHHG